MDRIDSLTTKIMGDIIANRNGEYDEPVKELDTPKYLTEEEILGNMTAEMKAVLPVLEDDNLKSEIEAFLPECSMKGIKYISDDTFIKAIELLDNARTQMLENLEHSDGVTEMEQTLEDIKNDIERASDILDEREEERFEKDAIEL